ncbi:MAG: hypothetical protein MI861_11015 [Pirellulales bacterium]|nr:hypothetical protein [Pirellulales bacterium]
MQPEIVAHYLGRKLNSPVIVGACPLTQSADNVREYAIAGAGAVVLPSLLNDWAEDPATYSRTIHQLKRVTSIPIIASLEGGTDGNWIAGAKQIESSGVDAFELRLQTDLTSQRLDSAAVERQMLECVKRLCDSIHVPGAVKVLPFYTCLPNLTRRLIDAGAAGVVIFGRDPTWVIQPDRLSPSKQWSLTPAGCISLTISGLIRTRFVGQDVSIAACGGISSPSECAKVILAGADVVMVTSEVQREGADAISHMVEGLISFLTRHGYESFESFVHSRPAPRMSPLADSATRSRPDLPDYHEPTLSVSNRAPSTWSRLGNVWRN